MATPQFEAPRRQLAGRRPEMVARLLDAAVTEVAATGYDRLTVRNVAKAAGVSPATAYTHFASKEHLLAEAFWRRLQLIPPVAFEPGATIGQRVSAAVAPIALSVADEPEFAAGITTALLAHDADVQALRNLIGALMTDRLSEALGPDVPDLARLGFTMMLTGSLLTSGMGLLDYRDLPGLLGGFADLLVDRPWEDGT